jgi:hypothetical protein
VDKAKQARELYNALGTPLIQDFKAILHISLIANNLVTTKNIKLQRKFLDQTLVHQKAKLQEKSLCQ